jgi:hypothetical protein
MAETYPVRQDPLPLIKTPSLPNTGQIGMKEVLGIQEPYMREKARLIPEISAAKSREAEAKQEQQVIEAEGGATAARGFAEAEKGAMQQYQTKLEKEPLPAFIPSKENAQDLAVLFSLVGVIGMLVGGGGKENSQQAMSAMNGMLEGHQKGRADLYKQELSTFDKNFKSMVQKHAEFRKEMEDAVKLASTDKEGAMANAKLAAVKSGSNIVKAMLDQGRLLDAYKFVDESQTGVEKAVQAETKLRADAAKEAAAERRHREDMAQKERMAKERMSHAEKMRELAGVRKTASATNERYANTVLRSSNEVLRSLELIEKIGITTGGGVLGNVVGKGSIPSDIQRYIGQNFTEEKERNYNTAMSGISLELAYVLGGGYKPDVSTVNKLETLLSVGPNDTYGNAAYKFADVTAKLKAAIETSPAYTDEQKASKDKILEKLNKYATPEEVQERIYGKSRSEEPAVRTGTVYEPKTAQDFNAIPSKGLYKDPDDGKIYRKK